MGLAQQVEELVMFRYLKKKIGCGFFFFFKKLSAISFVHSSSLAKGRQEVAIDLPTPTLSSVWLSREQMHLSPRDDGA